MVYNTYIIEDSVLLTKFTIMEMQLAEKSLQNEIYSEKKKLTNQKFKEICF